MLERLVYLVLPVLRLTSRRYSAKGREGEILRLTEPKLGFGQGFAQNDKK